jgi:hypothetical protein
MDDASFQILRQRIVLHEWVPAGAAPELGADRSSAGALTRAAHRTKPVSAASPAMMAPSVGVLAQPRSRDLTTPSAMAPMLQLSMRTPGMSGSAPSSTLLDSLRCLRLRARPARAGEPERDGAHRRDAWHRL